MVFGVASGTLHDGTIRTNGVTGSLLYGRPAATLKTLLPRRSSSEISPASLRIDVSLIEMPMSFLKR
eukprot:2601462-Prorocentrum_lima.AAC.1